MTGHAEIIEVRVNDEVIYPSNNPRSGFISRVIQLSGDDVVCQTSDGGSFTCKVSDLRVRQTEGT